jgi:hypothetical protein
MLIYAEDLTITSKEVYTAFSIFIYTKLFSIRGCNQSNLSSIIYRCKINKIKGMRNIILFFLSIKRLLIFIEKGLQFGVLL